MKREKKNGLEIVIIFLSLLITCMFFYIVYDKMFKVEEEKVVNNDENKLLDSAMLEDFSNYDGSYATIKRILFESEDGSIYNLNLGMDGRVYLNDYAARIYIEDVKNIIDIVSLESDAIGKCYMLKSDGNVYLYTLSDIIAGNYKVELVDSVSNVVRLINYYNASTENASSSSGVIALLKDGSYVQLDVMNG